MKHASFTYFLSIALLLGGCTPPKTSPILKKSYVHNYGAALNEVEWEATGKTGSIITHYNTGEVLKESFVRGVKQGESTTTYPNSTAIQKKQTYKNGTCVKIEFFATNGLPTETHDILNDVVQVTAWYSHGAPRTTQTFVSNKLIEATDTDPQGKEEARVQQSVGESISRDFNGQLLYKDAISSGLVVSRIYFHPQGSPEKKVTYRNPVLMKDSDIISGTVEIYNFSGDPSSIEEWENNARHGICTMYQNGQKYSAIPYVKGHKHGVEMRFDPQGAVISEISWRNDVQHGPTKHIVDGKQSTQWFYKGELVTKSYYDLKTRP